MAGMMRRFAGGLLLCLCAAPAAAQQSAPAPVIAPPVVAAVPPSVRGGAELWRRGDWAGAVTMWQPLAAAGNPDAMFNMGQANKLGRGLPRDDRKARDWYRRAAERGHRPAQANLGILLFQDGEKAEALKWLKTAADAGEPRAQYVYGVAHWNGDGLKKSLVMAYAYLARGADQGLDEARSALGRLVPMMSVADRTSGWRLASSMARSDGSVAPLASIPDPAPRPAALASASGPAPVPQTPSSNPAAVISATAPRSTAAVEQPSAAPTAAAPAAASPFRIQLGAFSRRDLAEAELAALKARAPALIEGLEPVYQFANTLVRLQMAGFESRSDAAAACNRFASAGRSCIVAEAR